MGIRYRIIGFMLGGISLLIFYGCPNGSATTDRTTQQDTTTTESRLAHENPYEGLRAMALSTTPEQLQLNLPDDRTVVYGMVMDWEMGGAVATLVAYQSGDASLYLSTGGAVIGGGQHEKVNRSARRYVESSQIYLDQATPTDQTPLPQPNTVRFYFLTNRGILVGQETMENLERRTSDWNALFVEGNNVMTQLRLTTEAQKHDRR